MHGNNPTPGIYEAWVDSTFVPNGTVMVRLSKPTVNQGPKFQCVWAAGVLSGLLGFRLNYLPPVNTRVVVALTGREINYIIGAVPEAMVRPQMPGQSRAATGFGAPDYTASQIFNSPTTSNRAFNAQGPSVDMVEGEMQIHNNVGVGLDLLRYLASLHAGDLARVECHLQDDMVRIISDTFRHITAMGDYHIANDGGRLNAIRHWTSYDHEAWGVMKPDDIKVRIKEGSDTTVDPRDVDGEDDDLRARFSEFIGELGNFIQMWVTDPLDSLGRLAEGNVRAGKARLHMNNDGTILMQTVADIVLEKVVAIPVPNQVHHEDDPNGDRSDRANTNLDPLKTWKPSNQANIFEMAFQLREYARWLNNSLALGRFRQRRFDYQIPTEKATFDKQADVNNRESDRLEANGEVTNWRTAYACIRIYRDGSVQFVDAYGNSYTSTAVGVQISSARDLLLEAAGSINLVAGRDVNVLARKNVNLTAVKEQIRLKAQTGLAMLVAAGNAVLELASEKWLKLIGRLNVNNTVAVDDGNVVASGIVQGTTVQGTSKVVGNKVAAAANNPGLIDSRGDVAVNSFYVEIGQLNEQSIPSVSEQFSFQSSYGTDPLYESLTQQALRHGEQVSDGAWNFSDNAVAGKGSPWPGQNAKQKVGDGGENLNQPSESTSFTADPKAMTDKAIEMRYRS